MECNPGPNLIFHNDCQSARRIELQSWQGWATAK